MFLIHILYRMQTASYTHLSSSPLLHIDLVILIMHIIYCGQSVKDYQPVVDLGKGPGSHRTPLNLGKKNKKSQKEEKPAGQAKQPPST